MISPEAGEKFVRDLYKYVGEKWATDKGFAAVCSRGQERIGYPQLFDMEEGIILSKPHLTFAAILGRSMREGENGLAFRFGGIYGSPDNPDQYTATDLFLLTKHLPLGGWMQGRIFFDTMLSRVETDCWLREEHLFHLTQQELLSEDGKQVYVAMIEDLIKRSRPSGKRAMLA